MKNYIRPLAVAAVSLPLAVSLYGQVPVQFGRGSIASFPPGYKAKTTDSNSGFNASAMLSRRIYADEEPGVMQGSLEAPGRSIPTNDWWTDIINSQFSGALWSYPAMLKTSEAGVEIYRPSYWADQGKEIKSNSHVTVGAKDYQAESAVAADWHDCDVRFRMPAKSGPGEIAVTSAHGSPFTWFEFDALNPKVEFSGSPEFFGSKAGSLGVKIGSDLYGLYFPENESWTLKDGRIVFDGPSPWLVVALLRSEADLDGFAGYAVSVPRNTTVDWTYNEATAQVTTRWTIEAENLRDGKASAPVMMGFLPHVYKYTLPGASLSFKDSDGFLTPRGTMKLAASDSGTFGFAYRFSGMLPVFGAPREEADGFSRQIMDRLMADYARGGGFGADTYWGGKGLLQMAMNMWFAKLTGNDEVYDISKNKLREAFENWLTYTPGEDNFFFSYYPRWGGMLGFDVSYDSDAFNDHHFHYGYFTYAAALLCMEDPDFAAAYGEILTLIAKDYANWDRSDSRFPFMRTLDPWSGHSWAGGLGDHGNDNGNGQESSSEAMQSWGGLYLLGVALGDKEMRDAGIWGWSTEARATREYWFDVDAPRPANAGGRNPWPGKGNRDGNYNYDEYPYAYNSNITGKGIGWWTWFGGDPLFMHGIQWMPVSPALDYLSWDSDFVAWAYDDLMRGANSTFSHSWFDYTSNTDNGERIDPLATNDWGNVTLCYLQRTDPESAADIFDEALAKGSHIASSVGTAHISYYTIHSHLTYGDPDFTIYADIPTTQVCVKDGVKTFLVYNPGEEDRKVTFFDGSGKSVKTVNAPARKLAAISADPAPTDIEFSLEGGDIIPPGSSAALGCRVIDQYGAGMPSERVTVTLSAGAPAAFDGNLLKINANAQKGTSFNIILSSGLLSRTVPVSINDVPKAVKTEISGIAPFSERGEELSPELLVTDQYGTLHTPDDTRWTVTRDGESVAVTQPLRLPKAGKYKVAATSASLSARAEMEVVATPPLPVLSLGGAVMASSAENAGTMPSGLNDGNTSTRWGSAHNDDEWVVVDLGEDCFISRVSILWEAAYASHYKLQVAPDGCSLVSVPVNYAGQSSSVSVPAESVWTDVADVRISAAGERSDRINASGRYLRMKGLERATAYGYSIYELTACGMRLSASDSDILGIDFSLPQTMECNETFVITPEVYTYAGSATSGAAAIKWASDRQARFSGSAFTPLSPGLHHVTARLGDAISSENTVFVNDAERPVGIEFERDYYTTIEGDPVRVPFTVTNQYMAPFTGSADFLSITVTDGKGVQTDDAAYDASEMVFVSSKSGDYVIRFGDMGSVSVSVKRLAEVNLALEKPASASSVEGANTASKAFDGKMDSRWESAWADGQTLEVDLQSLFMLNKVVIAWENAYAAEYDVTVSADGEIWTSVHRQTAGKGQTETIVFNPEKARYVRLDCRKRSSGYGFSVWEMEVYGTERIEDSPAGCLPVLDGENEGKPEYYDLRGLPVARPSRGEPVIERRGGEVRKVIVEN